MCASLQVCAVSALHRANQVQTCNVSYDTKSPFLFFQTTRLDPRAIRDSTFGRPEREVPRRDRALRDSWQSSSALGSSTSSSYRPAPAGRGSRAPPDRLPSDNSRGSLDNTRDSFAPSTSSSRAVFRTQSGPPLRDREDFGFGSGAGSYHDAPAFKPAVPRGVPLTGRGPVDKVSMQFWLVLW